MSFYLLVFQNTHDALAAERHFKSQGIPFSVFPTPPQITGSCGISLRYTEEEREDIEKELEGGLAFKEIYGFGTNTLKRVR